MLFNLIHLQRIKPSSTHTHDPHLSTCTHNSKCVTLIMKVTYLRKELINGQFSRTSSSNVSPSINRVITKTRSCSSISSMSARTWSQRSPKQKPKIAALLPKLLEICSLLSFTQKVGYPGRFCVLFPSPSSIVPYTGNDLRFSRHWTSILRSSIWRSAAWYLDSNVSEEHTVSIFPVNSAFRIMFPFSCTESTQLKRRPQKKN